MQHPDSCTCPRCRVFDMLRRGHHIYRDGRRYNLLDLPTEKLCMAINASIELRRGQEDSVAHAPFDNATDYLIRNNYATRDARGLLVPWCGWAR